MKIINTIQKSVQLTIITSLLLGLMVLMISKLLAKVSVPLIENYFELNFYTKNVIFKLYLIVLSISSILCINKGSLKEYGFRLPEKTNYFKLSLLTVGMTIGSMIIGGVIFLGVLNHIFPSENMTGFPEASSFLERIITVWIVSSICEEVLVRGLVQGFMNHLKGKKIMRLSLPVIISGLFFGAMHLSLLTSEMGHWFVCFIVFFTTVIGFLAAYYREKTNSLIAPILVHVIANIVGSLPLIIQMILQ